jgi:hypothetical protein
MSQLAAVAPAFRPGIYRPRGAGTSKIGQEGHVTEAEGHASFNVTPPRSSIGSRQS